MKHENQSIDYRNINKSTNSLKRKKFKKKFKMEIIQQKCYHVNKKFSSNCFITMHVGNKLKTKQKQIFFLLLLWNIFP